MIELARDLVEMEQKLLTVTKENKDLMAQIQAFGRSMSSLQDSRDHATEELGDLKKKYDASLKELAQLKGLEAEKQSLQMSSDALQKEKQGLSKEIKNLQTQLTALQEEGTLGVYHAQLKAKEEELQRLNMALSSSQKRTADLEEELVCVQKEATRKVSEIEDQLKKELKHLHHDAGIMRNETETAEERVAELARDLVEMEQKLLTVTKENKDLMAQIQAFGRSMSSLQDSRDHATEELGDLKKKYDASLKELAQLKEWQDSSREGDVLSQAAFPLSTSENVLSRLEKLNQQLTSKDEQLLHLSSELESSHNQVQSISKAMTSLQNERDRLWSELEKFRKSEEGKQRAAAPSAASSPAEVQSLKKAMSSLQESQDQTKALQVMEEELRQENLSWQHELRQLRMEKNSWELHERRMKEQFLMAISDKDQQLGHLQSLLRELRSSSQAQILSTQYQRQASPETSASLDGSQKLVYETELLRTQLNDSLKEIHQKELRIQQLNSKFSQLLEEKNVLSTQLSDASQSLRENQHHYSNLFNHCAILEKEVQKLQAGPLNTDVAPGAPQEKNGMHRKSEPETTGEEQPSFSEVQQQLCNTKQDLRELKKLLEEERDQRLTAENALSLAKEQIRRLEHSEWESARTPIMGACGSQEQALLIDLPGHSCRRTRSGAGWKRVLRSLCHSRTRVPLLAAIYFLMIHVLLVLCFTGHL